MLNEKVIAVLQNNIWEIATCADNEPNVVPVGFKNVTADGKLTVGDVFLATTLQNIAANGRIAISAYDGKTMEGYQVKGSAVYVTEGEVLEAYKAAVSAMFSGAVTAKGALIITPEQVIVTTPGADNKKVL